MIPRPRRLQRPRPLRRSRENLRHGVQGVADFDDDPLAERSVSPGARADCARRVGTTAIRPRRRSSLRRLRYAGQAYELPVPVAGWFALTGCSPISSPSTCARTATARARGPGRAGLRPRLARVPSAKRDDRRTPASRAGAGARRSTGVFRPRERDGRDAGAVPCRVDRRRGAGPFLVDEYDSTIVVRRMRGEPRSARQRRGDGR